MAVVTKVLTGEYRDSLFLMRLSEELSSKPGIRTAVVIMGTPSNRDILSELGLLHGEAIEATSDDLVIAIDTSDSQVPGTVIDEAIASLKQPVKKMASRGYNTLRDALQDRPEANILSLSVPGEHAVPLAKEAIEAKRNVFCFSSNVDLKDEIELKHAARDNNVLFMGPDCGTTVIDKLGLGFANTVRTGSIGVVSASGSGLQEFMILVDQAGGGISNAIGVGSRDLLTEVGGITTLQAMQRLASSGQNDVLVLIAKKSTSMVIEKISELALQTGLPVIIYLADQESSIHFHHQERLFLTKTIAEAAELALSAIGLSSASNQSTDSLSMQDWINSQAAALPLSQKWIRGLFAGGSLRSEAGNIIQRTIGQVYTEDDITKQNEHALEGHFLIDLGAEEFTQGRAHPFIDTRFREIQIQKAFEDPNVACLLVDIVLGWGSHQNPAGAFVQGLKRATESKENRTVFVPVIASLCGSAADPQNLSEQMQILLDQGVFVTSSSSKAAFVAVKLLLRSLVLNTQSRKPVDQCPILDSAPTIINIGLEHFAQSVESQGSKVIRVDWRPPVKRTGEISRLLDELL